MAARLRVRWLAAWRDITKIRMFHLGAWVEIVRIRRWTKTGTNTFAWKDVYVKGGTTPPPSPPPASPPPSSSVTLSVTPSPSSVTGTRVGQGVVYTNTVTVTASKGVGPYTYVFSRSSYSGTVAPAIVIGTSPNKAQFSRNMTGAVPETQTARFKCRVTDSKGNTGSCYIDAGFLTVADAGTGGDGSVNNTYDPSDPLHRNPGSGGEVP